MQNHKVVLHEVMFCSAKKQLTSEVIASLAQIAKNNAVNREMR